MNLKSLSMPETLPEMAKWLDDLLVSPELTDMIVELEVLAGDRLTRNQTLNGILAEDQDLVLNGGLGESQGETIRAFLRQPILLLELQELVMMHGAEYWQHKADTAIGKADDAVANASSNLVAATTDATKSTRSGWSRTQKVAAAIAALAAAVLVMVSLSFPAINGGGAPVAKSGWGFSKSGFLEAELPEAEMLEQLAAASASWHNKIPANVEQLEKRLRAFDVGCQTLLDSSLPQLSANSRKAVHDACEQCRRQIASRLTDLKSGVRFATVLKDSNSAIDQLTQMIREIS